MLPISKLLDKSGTDKSGTRQLVRASCLLHLQSQEGYRSPVSELCFDPDPSPETFMRLNFTMSCALVAASLSCSTALPAVAQTTLPYSKPGLWLLTTKTEDGKPARVTKFCSDKLAQKYLIDMGSATLQSACAKHDMNVAGSTMTINAVCTIGKSTLTSKTVIHYAGDSSFHSETDGTFSPAFMGKTASHSVQDGAWSGACPAGMTPGDMYMGPDDRIKMHIGPDGVSPIKH